MHRHPACAKKNKKIFFLFLASMLGLKNNFVSNQIFFVNQKKKIKFSGKKNFIKKNNKNIFFFTKKSHFFE
jgi:hypothetical protein